MPRPLSDDPRFALAARCDMRPFSGQNLYRHLGGATVACPTWTTGQGIYTDVLAFLNGFGSSVAFDAALAPFDVSITLNDDDRIVITNDGAANATLAANASNAWFGLPTVQTVIASGGGTLVGSSEWRRGLMSNGADAFPPRLTFTITGEVGSFYAPPADGVIQDARVALRERGELDDADDTGAVTLESLANTVYETDTVRWFVNDDGHVGWSAVGNFALPIQWLSVAFRDLLGFDGTEGLIRFAPAPGAGVVEDDVCYGQIGNKPCPLLFVPLRPLIRQVPGAEGVGDALRLTNGSFTAVHIGTYVRQRLTFWVEGPQDVGTDWHRHWLRFRGHTPRGFPITLYQDFGDSRRALGAELVNAQQDPYTLLYTSQYNGHYGRIVGFVHPDTPDPDIDFEGSFRIRSVGSMVIAVPHEVY